MNLLVKVVSSALSGIVDDDEIVLNTNQVFAAEADGTNTVCYLGPDRDGSWRKADLVIELPFADYQKAVGVNDLLP